MQTTHPGSDQAKALARTPQATAATPMIERSAIEALHSRAKQLVLTMGWLGKAKELSFAQGALSELGALLDGDGPKFLAQRDASMGGYLPQAGFEAAWAGLPTGAERYTLSEVQQFLASHGIEVSTDAITFGNFYATGCLKDSKVAAVVDGNNEHDGARTDLNDSSSLHGAALLVAEPTL